MQRQRLTLIISIIIALGIGFGGGSWYVHHQTSVESDSIIQKVTNTDHEINSAVDFGLFWQVWDKLYKEYVDSDTLDAKKLVYGAISGMVDAAGDQYTVFFEPETSKKFQEEVSGAFSGVGMEIGKRNDAITVIAPIKNSPAMKAGIKSGDVVAKVDNQSTDGWSVEEAVSKIRGNKGTTVKLTIIRDGETEPLEFSLIRDTIRVPAVEWKMLENNVAYLQIFSFNGNVDSEFNAAAREIHESTAKHLIIDLRNNPGGLLDAAVNIGGWLLKSNSIVVQERYRSGEIDELRAKGNEQLATMPTIILINGGSASAAEILAGALHDIRNVQLVGEKSFGKGSVQQLEQFYNGSSLKVTIAKWLTPNGVSISETGISPTTEVKLDPKDPNAKNWEIGTPGKDPQLDKAIEMSK
jgi:carboxyl-terminal processing protease